MKWLLLVWLTGCNQIFGLDRTKLIDGGAGDRGIRLVTPPDGSMVQGTP